MTPEQFNNSMDDADRKFHSGQDMLSNAATLRRRAAAPGQADEAVEAYLSCASMLEVAGRLLMAAGDSQEAKLFFHLDVNYPNQN